MNIRSATFVKGVVGDDDALERDIPQIAFIGRSNVGKSTVINTLTHQKGLAKTSSFPGKTTEINLFLINKSFYLVDLPGYGFAKASREARERLQALIDWYLFESHYVQKKVVLIIDGYVGLTESDLRMIQRLEEHGKDIIILANKSDKIKKSEISQQLQKLRGSVGGHTIILCSAKKNTGLGELTNLIVQSIQ